MWASVKALIDYFRLINITLFAQQLHRPPEGIHRNLQILVRVRRYYGRGGGPAEEKKNAGRALVRIV